MELQKFPDLSGVYQCAVLCSLSSFFQWFTPGFRILHCLDNGISPADHGEPKFIRVLLGTVLGYYYLTSWLLHESFELLKVLLE